MPRRSMYRSTVWVLTLLCLMFGFGAGSSMGIISTTVPGSSISVPSSPSLFLVPAAPSELRAGAFPGVLTVSMDWKDNSSNESGFTIERSIDGGPFSTLTTVSSNTTAYNDADVIRGEYYTYRVCAISGTAKSAYSNEAEWYTIANPVTLQGGIDETSARVRVFWGDNNGHELEYDLYRTSESAGQTVIETIKLPADTYYYDDNAVLPHVKYTYQVVAINPLSGLGPLSNKLNVSFLARPTNVNVSSFPGSSELAVQWKNEEPSATGFILQKAMNDSPAITTTTLPAGTTQYNEAVEIDTHYMYRVQAVVGADKTPYSEVSHWYSPPRPPIDFTGHAESSTEVHLSWKDLARYESMYKIWRKGDNAFVGVELPPGSTSYIDKGLKPNTTYQYTIFVWTDSKTMTGDVPPVEVTTPAGSGLSNLSPLLQTNITNLTPVSNLPDGQTSTPMNPQTPAGSRLQAVLKIGSPRMTINGAEQEIDPGQGTAPVIIEGRTLVPIRAIIEAMNGTVDWDGASSKVTIHCNNQVVELWIGSLQTRVNGQDGATDVAPRIINGRTMLPVRFISENIGLDVSWDDAAQQVTIQNER